jgi:hypothetical protein
VRSVVRQLCNAREQSTFRGADSSNQQASALASGLPSIAPKIFIGLTLIYVVESRRAFVVDQGRAPRGGAAARDGGLVDVLHVRHGHPSRSRQQTMRQSYAAFSNGRAMVRLTIDGIAQEAFEDEPLVDAIAPYVERVAGWPTKTSIGRGWVIT